MPNTDAPSGSKPVRHASGGTIRQNEYAMTSGYASNIFTGDTVILTTAGVVELSAVGSINVIGVFAGCSYTNAGGERLFSRYWPASTVATNIKAYVWDDPYTVFEVQAVGTMTQALVGTNADILATAGSTTTGQSRQEVDLATAVATTAQCKILGLVDRADNELGADAKIEFIFEEHLLRTTVGI